MKLLYVEDDEGTRTMLGKLLRQKYPGYSIYVAANGEEGLALFFEHHPDLVITDITMPGMTGIEMSSAIKKSRPQAIIIAVTAHTDTDYVAQGRAVGIRDYIMKPIKVKEVFGVIDSSLAALAVHLPS